MEKNIKRVFKILFGRGLIFNLILIIQIVILLIIFKFFSDYVVWIFGGFTILSFTLIIYILNNDINPAYKLAWIIPILTVPVIGCLLYLYMHFQFTTKKKIEKHNQILDNTDAYLEQDAKVFKDLELESNYVLSMAKYINKYGGYPTYKNTEATYFSLGESFFESIKVELMKAKKYIFLEFFIVADDSMWNTILDILKLKVNDGVEVRMMYDGVGSLFTLPKDYDKYLESIGIKCQIFSPVEPSLATYQNNRDHRKILVIDGLVGYTGGINLADEYINKIEKHGHWKDMAIMLKGDAVNNLTMMFLQTWDMTTKQVTDYQKYITTNNIINDTYTIVYGDSPFDKENIGEEVYLDIINSATKYIHITTPYLIIDNEMYMALTHAAKRGVNVSIIIPGISDGKGGDYLAISYYKDLIKAGINIYEYTPGFIHGKVFTSDDDKAVVGTINLDYRSLYLHFECAVLLYKSSIIKSIDKDIEDTILKSTKITMKEYNKIPRVKKIIGRIMKLFAPLM